MLVHAIALALGNRPGERLAERLSMPISADTLLRLLRRRAAPTPSDVRVVGVDEFAWPKGQRHATLICDLERRRTIDFLPDREGATVADWLAALPGIEIVRRDRGSGYREGAARGAPGPGPSTPRREVTLRRIDPANPVSASTAGPSGPERAGGDRARSRLPPRKTAGTF